MGESLLILLREGFEASLIVAIVFAYLRRTGRLDLGRAVWVGVAAASGLAIVLGVLIHLTVGELSGAAELRSFAAIAVAAAVVLTWMVFWMRRQSRAIKGDLEHKVDVALHSGHVARGLMFVAFFAVLREGIETALFLVAATTSSAPRDVLVGGTVGLAASCVLGYLVYAGGHRIPMRAFFRVTGMIVIVFAAGLCAKAVLFLQGAGDLGTVNNAVYDVTRISALTTQSQVGRFLAGLLGWDPRPSLEQVLAWVLYIVPTSYFFLRDPRPAGPMPVAAAVDSARPAEMGLQ
jgi:high-affinity iron transporter